VKIGQHFDEVTAKIVAPLLTGSGLWAGFLHDPVNELKAAYSF